MMPKRTSKVFFWGGGGRGGERGIRLVTFYGTTKFGAYGIIGKLLGPIESYRNLGDSQILV